MRRVLLALLALVLLTLFAAPAEAAHVKVRPDTGTIAGPIGDAAYGGTITFDVTSDARYYFVEVDCSQSGVVVYRSAQPWYLATFTRSFYLGSYLWTGGPADCTAELYSSLSDGSARQSLDTVAFSVAG